MATVYGYARVSKWRGETDRQVRGNLNVEIGKLTSAGVPRENIISEVISGGKRRPAFEKLLTETMQPGDTLVVSNLARLARSSKISEWALGTMEERGLNFHCLREDVDTNTWVGRMLYRMFSIISEAQLEAIREDSMAGQRWARDNGKRIGRPPVISGERAALIDRLRDEGVSKSSIARQLGISRPTLNAYLRNKE